MEVNLTNPMALTPQRGRDRDQELHAAAQRLVAQTFFGTLLKQVRNSPFKSELFSGGRGEDAFGPLLDQHLAQQMSRSTGNSLADSIVRQITGRRGIAPPASQPGQLDLEG